MVLLAVVFCGCERYADCSYCAMVYTKDTKCKLTYNVSMHDYTSHGITGLKWINPEFYANKLTECYVTIKRLEGNDTIKVVIGELDFVPVCIYEDKGYWAGDLLKAEAEGVVLPDTVRNHWELLQEIQLMLPDEQEKTFTYTASPFW